MKYCEIFSHYRSEYHALISPRFLKSTCFIMHFSTKFSILPISKLSNPASQTNLTHLALGALPDTQNSDRSGHPVACMHAQILAGASNKYGISKFYSSLG